MINIQSDSRKIKQGDTFVALRGISSDGHDYIERAISNGAIKVIAEEGNYEVETVIVPNTREYLNKYLYDNYSKYLEEMTIIGITGTNGKTTSAYLIYDALNKLGIKCAYIGTVGFYMDGKVASLNNTSPDVCDLYDLLIEAYENGYKHVALEASSQGLDGGRLEGIPFDYAIFSNLTQDHLDHHKTMENYALAKQLLFKKLKPNGISIVNYDDAYKDYFITDNTIYYGKNGGDFKITDMELTNQYSKFKYVYNGVEHEITSSLLGDYNVFNMLVNIIVLTNLGISDEDIKNIIPKVKAPAGRMDTVMYKNNSIIVDYAHTPDAIEKIINAAKNVTTGNIYTVFGCTGDRDRTKRPIMTKMVTDLCKYAIITNDDPHYEDPEQIVSDMTTNLTNTNYEVCLDRKEAIIKGINLLEDNDILLILGKGHEEVMIVKDKKIPMNDKRIVLEYLKN
ncbi:MAG: UDP-N-acetylmuramoyl-L-alanyl-D-glutamate--2,6-diaminopimelate ligase [Bacilli bacterium]|nr:UDP-N-acetylmuramoyl-L-alanyl-D-glutamate--2,6-diaminopimelate ligase [Bacilli bacterium]MDD4608307.1 UDP-N-acetylmuramoyl-L-alanyl-D-glutamate--2,6-diaminopimelate ligase [Bacilli bacterium]